MSDLSDNNLFFIKKDKISTTNTGNIFIDFVNSIPFITSNINDYINLIISSKLNNDFVENNYFKIILINSVVENLIKGNYTYTSEIVDNEIITYYNISYQDKQILKQVTITTIYNSLSNVLFYDIPKEFSYNSENMANVSIIINDNFYKGKIFIPQHNILPLKMSIPQFNNGFLLPFIISSNTVSDTYSDSDNSIDKLYNIMIVVNDPFNIEYSSFGLIMDKFFNFT
jgi:hypothetical protein